MVRRDDREYRGIFERGATQPAGMHRPSNAARLSPRAASIAAQKDGALTTSAVSLKSGDYLHVMRPSWRDPRFRRNGD
jgi:hypothetical protein